jgi:hypothetical protein
LSYLEILKKPYPRHQKVIMLEAGDQNQRIVKKIVKGYGDLAFIQRWGLTIFLQSIVDDW